MSIDSYPIGAILIISVTALSVLGLAIFHKYLKHDELRKLHEVGGYLLAVVGTMYAVLLGLVVVDAMNKFQRARDIVESEANCLADVFILSDRLPDPKAKKIHELCNTYCSLLISQEWKCMVHEEICPEARKTAIALIKEVTDFEPVTENQKTIYPLLVQEACSLWDNRRARTNIAQFGVPAPEWMVLLIGGIVTVVFTYFFSVGNSRAQMVMTAMVSLLISLNLYLVVLFGAPFSGDLCVGDHAFLVDKLIFENRLGYRHDKEFSPDSYVQPGMQRTTPRKAIIGLSH